MRSKYASAIAATMAMAVVLTGTAGCSNQESAEPAPSAGGETGPHAELVQKAQAEGKVVWYTPNTDDKIQLVVERFDELYGIQVEAFRGPSSKAVQRYESERDANAPVVDVLDIGTYTPFVDNADDFVNLTAQPLESLEAWPEDALFGDGIAASTGVNPIAVIYNTDLVSDSQLPQEWPDLFDSNVGPIATPDMSAADVWVMYLDFLDETYGEETLKAFAQSDRTPFDSAVTALQGVASGEYTFGIGSPSQVDELMKSGAPINYFVPDPTVYSARATGVPTNAPHPNAALLLMDFLMSTEGQVLTAGDTAASVLESATGTIQIGSGAVPMNEKRSLENRDRLLKASGF